MPEYYRHIISESGQQLYPLFVLFSETVDRIKQGLIGAHLPFVTVPNPSTHVSELTLIDTSEETLLTPDS